MSEMTARAALKLISPAMIRDVHFMFVAKGGKWGWLRVTKTEAKRLLRELPASETVFAFLGAGPQGGRAYIIGDCSDRRDVNYNPAVRSPA